MELEKKLGKPVPVVRTVLTERYGGIFGFVVKSDHITELGLTGNIECSLREIPESIGQLKHLEILSVQQTYELMDLPETLIYLTNLKHLIYSHYPLPYSKLNPNKLPDFICSLTSLEKLDLSDSSITTLPDCLVHFPYLMEINLSRCLKIQKLPQLIKIYFEDQQNFRPMRRFLIRKDYPQKIPEQDFIADLLCQYHEKKKNEAQIIDSILSIIKKSTKLEDKIKAILALKELSNNNEHLFKILEDYLKTDKSTLVRKACAEVILNKFPEKAMNVIGWILERESSSYIKNSIKDLIESGNLDSILVAKSQYKDLLILNDIQHTLDIDKRYFSYFLKNNRVTNLTLDMRIRSFNEVLITLPEFIGELNHLEILELIEGRSLTKIPESIGNLQKLKKLNCTKCRSLEALPETIGSLKNLEHLDFSGCFSLKQLPSEITKLNKLKSLNLCDCQSLTSLPLNIGDLESLEILDLTNCRSLKELPDSLINLPNLKSLHLKACRFMRRLPDDVGNLSPLEELTLDRCIHLSRIPESLSKLNLFGSLDLSFCYSLNEVPSSIGSMQNLKSINMKGCRALKTLPNEFGYLQNLENLNLYACSNIQVSSNTIKKLRALKTLDLSYCDKLLNLFEELKDIPDLEIIKAEKATTKRSGAIDDDIGLRIYQEKVQNGIPKDEIRDYNRYVEYYIDEGVTSEDAKILAHFSILIEGSLEKAEIDEDIFFDDHNDMFCTHFFRVNSEGHIIEIYLHSPVTYYLTILPQLLSKLKYLEVIFLPDNLIKEIPEWIVNLKFLRVLDVNNTGIGPDPYVPDSIKPFVESLESFNGSYR